MKSEVSSQVNPSPPAPIARSPVLNSKRSDACVCDRLYTEECRVCRVHKGTGWRSGHYRLIVLIVLIRGITQGSDADEEHIVSTLGQTEGLNSIICLEWLCGGRFRFRLRIAWYVYVMVCTLQTKVKDNKYR